MFAAAKVKNYIDGGVWAVQMTKSLINNSIQIAEVTDHFIILIR